MCIDDVKYPTEKFFLNTESSSLNLESGSKLYDQFMISLIVCLYFGLAVIVVSGLPAAGVENIFISNLLPVEI